MNFNDPEPIYTYFWVIILKDGKSAIPQFDLETGKENLWKDIPVDQITKAMWYPFSEEFARKVAIVNNILTLPTRNPVLSVDVPVGSKVAIYRPHEITRYDYYQCRMCGAQIFWDGSGELHCPNCLARNEWYCKRCKIVVDKPLYKINGEVRCPFCEEKGEPYGLNKIQMLDLVGGMAHEVNYCLGIEDGKIRKWNDRGEEIVDSNSQGTSQKSRSDNDYSTGVP
jgi:hypothetical protein